MLEFEHRPALFAHMNTTTEKHGNRRVPCADFKFEMRIDNGVLAHFDARLRSSFFQRAEDADLADRAAHPDQLLQPKFSEDRIGPIRWTQKIIGGTLTVHYGVNEKSDIVLDDTKIDGPFTMAFVDGGQVEMVFTIRGYPSTENAGKLYDMQRQKVEISFEPPDADYEPPLFGDEEDEDEDEDEAEEA